MKIKNTRLYGWRFKASLCACSLLFNSCATQSSVYQVQTKPMNVDLEMDILRANGLAGVPIGAVAVSFVSSSLISMAGGSQEQVSQAGHAGYDYAVGGGIENYQAQQLVEGARTSNQQLAIFETELSKKIASAKQVSNPKEKKFAYRTLAKQTNEQIKDADKVIATRKNALASDKWAKFTNIEKNQYHVLAYDMARQRNALASHSAQLAKLEQSVVY